MCGVGANVWQVALLVGGVQQQAGAGVGAPVYIRDGLARGQISAQSQGLAPKEYCQVVQSRAPGLKCHLLISVEHQDSAIGWRQQRRKKSNKPLRQKCSKQRQHSSSMFKSWRVSVQEADALQVLGFPASLVDDISALSVPGPHAQLEMMRQTFCRSLYLTRHA